MKGDPCSFCSKPAIGYVTNHRTYGFNVCQDHKNKGENFRPYETDEKKEVI